MHRTFLNTVFIVIAAAPTFAQPPAAPGRGRGGAAPPARPPLFLREDWKQMPAGDEHPVTQQSIAIPNLELKLYGTTSKEVQLTGSPTNESNPTHVWTGMCSTPCAVAFRDKNNFADVSGLARIKWVTKVSGFHQVRPIVKLADGTWLVGDHTDGSPMDRLTSEFSLAEVRWLQLDIANVVTKGNVVDAPAPRAAT
jgi:hypothetical protein